MANRLQTLNGLGLNGERRPKDSLPCMHLLGVCTGDLFYFCILVLLTPSIRGGRQQRLVTGRRVLNQPGRMVRGSEFRKLWYSNAFCPTWRSTEEQPSLGLR